MKVQRVHRVTAEDYLPVLKSDILGTVKTHCRRLFIWKAMRSSSAETCITHSPKMEGESLQSVAASELATSNTKIECFSLNSCLFAVPFSEINSVCHPL